MSNLRRKRIRHFHEPGDLHELTFSCYRRLPLLTNDVWRHKLSQCINHAVAHHSFQLAAFVFMPEHLHLLVNPLLPEPQIDRFLATIKRPMSASVKQSLVVAESPLLKKLTIRERPGKTVFRFWQEGPGYDRNLHSEKTVRAAIDYIHLNPVRRGLCEQARHWRWSSARWYESDGQSRDDLLPEIHGLSEGFFL